MTSRWLKWQPSSSIETHAARKVLTKLTKPPSAESFVSFVSTFAHVQKTISATIMRIEQTGGSVRARSARSSSDLSENERNGNDRIEVFYP